MLSGKLLCCLEDFDITARALLLIWFVARFISKCPTSLSVAWNTGRMPNRCARIGPYKVGWYKLSCRELDIGHDALAVLLPLTADKDDLVTLCVASLWYVCRRGSTLLSGCLQLLCISVPVANCWYEYVLFVQLLRLVIHGWWTSSNTDIHKRQTWNEQSKLNCFHPPRDVRKTDVSDSRPVFELSHSRLATFVGTSRLGLMSSHTFKRLWRYRLHWTPC